MKTMANEISDKNAGALPHGLVAADASRAFRELAAWPVRRLCSGCQGMPSTLRLPIGERAHA